MNKDRKGGIEGLPLQLMIVILVATMGSAVIMGWMGGIDSPHLIKSIGIEENVVVVEDGVIGDIHVCVVDESNEPLKGVSVLITNKQVSGPVTFVSTDSNGRAVLSGWTLENYPKSTIKLNISAYLSGYTDCTEQVEGLII
ncbi:MAG: carboxypeptidase regulatory-like domain-containing protein [Candidatus Methanomethylophilaceae archaeon]|nr:carboxypeptidase regulatory-like domain-containing protein [Candidatus Methanomethylophilaceae archaeon]